MPAAEELLPRLEANFAEWKRQRQAQLDAEVAKIDAQVLAAAPARAKTAPGGVRRASTDKESEHRRSSFASLRERLGSRKMRVGGIDDDGGRQKRSSTMGRLESAPAPASSLAQSLTGSFKALSTSFRPTRRSIV